MNAPDPTTVDQLTAGTGLGSVIDLVPLTGGANNRVFRVIARNGQAVLKEYFRHPDDTRDRLGAEVAFTRFAWAAGIRCIPKPLAHDAVNALGLCEFVEGGKPTEVSESHVIQAIDFLRDLNAARWRPRAALLPLASEACFSLAEHLGTVARRVDRLATVSDPVVAAFVREDLIPGWSEVRATCEAEVSDSGLSLQKPLDSESRCVSPSDFGFHNAILAPDGRVRFIDFEYAGWDDPAKLVCDFFCQPAVPVPGQYFEMFTSELRQCFPNPEQFIRRAQMLLPVYRLKWVCIRLNEFLPVGTRRRAFSLPKGDLERRRQLQLDAARAALHCRERVAA